MCCLWISSCTHQKMYHLYLTQTDGHIKSKIEKELEQEEWDTWRPFPASSRIRSKDLLNDLFKPYLTTILYHFCKDHKISFRRRSKVKLLHSFHVPRMRRRTLKIAISVLGWRGSVETLFCCLKLMLKGRNRRTKGIFILDCLIVCSKSMPIELSLSFIIWLLFKDNVFFLHLQSFS